MLLRVSVCFYSCLKINKNNTFAFKLIIVLNSFKYFWNTDIKIQQMCPIITTIQCLDFLCLD